MESKLIEARTAFLKTWTQNGRQEIRRAAGNFWMPGKNRKRCSIIFPEEWAALEAAGVVTREENGAYRFVRK